MGPESSLNKVFWSEMDVRLNEAALGLLGDRAFLTSGAPDAVDDGAWGKAFIFALAGPIYAGTNEIQRNVIAERLLGLPRKSARCASRSPTTRSPSATPSPTSSPRSARRRSCGPPGRAGPSTCGARSPRWAWSA